jgi:AcrR family transcriptional regulator
LYIVFDFIVARHREHFKNQCGPVCSEVNNLHGFVREKGVLKMKKMKLDRRIQRTRKILSEALISLVIEKGYEKTTVQNIIDRANVGRSTFYAHFPDKDALLRSGFDNLSNELSKTGAGGKSGWDVALALFQHTGSHYPLYKAMVGKHSWDMIQQYAHKFLFNLVREYLKPKISARKKTPVPLDIAAHFIVSSFLALLTWWLDHKMPYSAEEMTEMFKGLTKPGADAVLGFET